MLKPHTIFVLFSRMYSCAYQKLRDPMERISMQAATSISIVLDNKHCFDRSRVKSLLFEGSVLHLLSPLPVIRCGILRGRWNRTGKLCTLQAGLNPSSYEATHKSLASVCHLTRSHAMRASHVGHLVCYKYLLVSEGLAPSSSRGHHESRYILGPCRSLSPPVTAFTCI
jgi:hypothetical protein